MVPVKSWLRGTSRVPNTTIRQLAGIAHRKRLEIKVCSTVSGRIDFSRFLLAGQQRFFARNVSLRTIDFALMQCLSGRLQRFPSCHSPGAARQSIPRALHLFAQFAASTVSSCFA
jgi:hypothetical protein